MSNVIKPDKVSLSTHQIYLSFEEQVLASASAFIYEYNRDLYLVTNWHNVSGRSPKTQECLNKNLAIPDQLSIYFRREQELGVSELHRIDLYDKDQDPVWLQHPDFENQNIDVVAIKLPENLTHGFSLFPINTLASYTPFPLEVTDSVFIVGYPFFEQSYAHLPIWKKGSIASEPTSRIEGSTDKIYVDTATRKGLSGSPVIASRIGVHGLQSNGKFESIGEIRDFIGIYSGRVGKGEFKAQLGIVWKKQVIEEILSQKG